MEKKLIINKRFKAGVLLFKKKQSLTRKWDFSWKNWNCWSNNVFQKWLPWKYYKLRPQICSFLFFWSAQVHHMWLVLQMFMQRKIVTLKAVKTKKGFFYRPFSSAHLVDQIYEPFLKLELNFWSTHRFWKTFDIVNRSRLLKNKKLISSIPPITLGLTVT